MILLVSNSRDFGVDDIVDRLRIEGEQYVRLDLDLLHLDRVALDPVGRTLSYAIEDGEWIRVKEPRSVLYRAPTHLRESSGHRYPPLKLLERHQWAAFSRSLMVFENARWVNHPMLTFAAESKPVQLARAAGLGLRVPKTAVTNALPAAFEGEDTVAVKPLDTFLVRHDEEDLFHYTTRMKAVELDRAEARAMPFIMQKYLTSKVDLRVTVVGDRCFAAKADRVVDGDWRREKDSIRFGPTTLPAAVEDACLRLVSGFGLVYGAIDLALTGGEYEFFEVNPTGEWAWLNPVFEGAISKTIADTLIHG